MDDLCITCLSAGRNLIYIGGTELQQIYLQILNEPVTKMLESYLQICWECQAILNRFQQFKTQTQSCYAELWNHVQQGLTPLHSLVKTPCLKMYSVVNIHITDKNGEEGTHFEPETFADELKLKKKKKVSKKSVELKKKMRHKVKKEKVKKEPIKPASDKSDDEDLIVNDFMEDNDEEKPLSEIGGNLVEVEFEPQVEQNTEELKVMSAAQRKRAKALVNTSCLLQNYDDVVSSIPVTNNEEELKMAMNSISQDVNVEGIPDNFILDCSLETIYNMSGIDFQEISHYTSQIVEANPPKKYKTTPSAVVDAVQQLNNNVDLEEIPINVITNETKQVPTQNIETQTDSTSSCDESINNHSSINQDLEDINSIPTEQVNKKPKRGRKRKFEDQNREIKKKRCNTNEDYINVKGKKVKSKTFTGNSFDCHCSKKCTEKLSANQRKAEFDKFWSAGSYEARFALLQGYVKENAKKRSYSTKSKRMYTRKYCIQNVDVCKKTLLNTLAVSQSRVDIALKKNRNNEPIDKRGIRGGQNSIKPEQVKDMRNFIEQLPRYSSHYYRESTNANYLAPNLNLTILYGKYKDKSSNPVSFSRFRQYFVQDFNRKFKKPQKDT
ncbi:uncharacterized protein LOC121736879 isoform X1 [Aricia agestis]|uniref:uncharacterized protein LOC121736879 isoform X1 n=1 Tax=Aricia agestis TaxID=91739 RepID=UPI001C2029E8|nr:uncharacterized protein LOC121736879 isoform X1 [Aricia agestis]